MNALKTKLATAFALTAVLSTNAMAAIDTTAITGEVTSTSTAIGVVGAAILIMFVGAKAFKWIRSVL